MTPTRTRIGAPPAPINLLGRQEELSWLEFCREEARAGRPRLVVVSGDLGVGKSRLVREFLARSHQLPMATGLGRGYEEYAIPYMPFTELLRSLEKELQLADIELPPGASPLEPFEQGADPLSQDPLAPASAIEQGRFFRNIASRLIAIANRRPLLLVVDDFHWLDQASAAIVNHLALAISDASLHGPVPIMLVLAMRPAERDNIATRTRVRLLREPLAQLLELGGLDLPGTAQLIRSSGVPHPSSQLVDAVFATTAGNPLFVEALIRELLLRNGIQHVSGDAVLRVDLERLPLSVDVTSAAAARIEAIPAEALEFFELAALLGQRLATRSLAWVADLPEAEVIRNVDASEGLLRRDGPLLEFSHPLFRHLLGEQIDLSRRQQMSARIAERLIALPASAPQRSEWQIAHFLMASGPAADVETLYEYARRAGDRASALCGWREAAEVYLAAADVAPTQEDRALLHYRAACCFSKNYDYGQSAEAFATALGDYRALGDRVGLAAVVAEGARSSLYLQPLGTMREMESFTECLDSLDEEDYSLRGRLLVRMADAYFYARRPDRGLHYAEDALACANLCDDSELREDACLSRGLALQQTMRFQEAEQSFREGLMESESGAELRWETPMRVRHACVLYMLGEVDEAERELHRALEAARQTNDPGEEALAAAYLMVAAAGHGRFDDVASHFETITRLRFRLERRPWAPLVGVPALAYTRLMQGQVRAAEDAIQAIAEPGRMLSQVSRPVRSLAGIYGALVRSTAVADPTQGEGQALRSRIARACERMSESSADGTALGIAAALVELADLHGMPSALEGPASALERASEAGAIVCTPWPALIPRLLGLAAFGAEQYERAADHFETALAEGERLRMRPELARTQLDYARMLVAIGDPAGEVRARDLLEHAERTFSELSMEPFHRRAVNLAGSLGMTLSIPRDSEQTLQPRDLDLLKRVASGHTEGRVADDLLLGHDTVRDNLSKLYGQLGVEGRLGATADAVERGLVSIPRRGVSVALMVTDMRDFTPMVERLGDVDAQKVVQLHNRMLRGRIKDFSGVEITHTGDGVIVSFRSVAEAVGCAIAIQRNLAEYNESAGESEIHVRIGVHAGEALPEEGRLFGTAVNTTVRICSSCEPDHIIASQLVYDRAGTVQSRFDSLGMAPLKGISGEVPLYEVTWS